MVRPSTYALLRFSGSQPKDPAVQTWFEARPERLTSLVGPWWAALRTCGPDVRECLHDGCPVVCVDDAPFGYVNVFTAHAAVGFFHGASLPDPAGILTGTGRYMRHLKLRPEAVVDAAALDALVRAAYVDIRQRLAADATRPPLR